MSEAAARLIGGWRLKRWTILRGGRETFPFGLNPTGLIASTPDGSMSATISAADRPPLSAGSGKSAPESERAAAFSSFFAYAGRWRVEDDEVVHEVLWSLNPAMAGTEQRRRMTFGGKALTLSAEDRDEGGVARLHRIEWERSG